MLPYQSINLNKLISDPDSLDWEEHNAMGRRGSRIHVLYRCADTGQQVSLVQSDPGAHASLHHHGGHETILVLRGSFEDDRGLHRAGDLVHYGPGTCHSWKSEEGGIMYVVWGGLVTEEKRP